MNSPDGFLDKSIVWRESVLPVKTIEPILSNVVSKVFSVPQAYILFRSRHYAPVAFARQVAIYLCHTVFGLKHQEVGILFNRDRSSVAHACRRVEGQRDSQSFNFAISCIENAVINLFKNITVQVGSEYNYGR